MSVSIQDRTKVELVVPMAWIFLCDSRASMQFNRFEISGTPDFDKRLAVLATKLRWHVLAIYSAKLQSSHYLDYFDEAGLDLFQIRGSAALKGLTTERP